jgi:hypothetical protein
MRYVLALTALLAVGACALSLDAEKLGLSAKTAKVEAAPSPPDLGGKKLPPMVSVRGDRFLPKVVIV